MTSRLLQYTRTIGVPTVTVGLLLGGLSCDRSHLSATYGIATRTAFTVQRVSQDAGRETAPDIALDPDEAAAIARGYRRSLLPAQGDDGSPMRSSVLVVPSGSNPSLASPMAREGR